jgi:cell division septation protein DedD
MTSYYQNHSQFELFPTAASKSVEQPSQRFSFNRLSLTFENVGVLGILVIMSMVVSFSLGVERGKHISKPKQPLPDQETQQATIEASVQQPPEIGGAPTQEITLASTGASQEAGAVSAGTVTLPVESVSVSDTTVSLSQGSTDLVQAVAEGAKKSIDKAYTVQVASFKKEKFAHEAAVDLKKKGYEILVLPKGKYSILCVGRFTHKDEAESFSTKLKKRYRDCLVRRL